MLLLMYLLLFLLFLHVGGAPVGRRRGGGGGDQPEGPDALGPSAARALGRRGGIPSGPGARAVRT